MQTVRSSEELGRRWRPALIAYFLRRVRDHAEAEDLTQELLARLIERDSEGISAPEAYIFQMASNLLADRGRRGQVRSRYQSMMMQSPDRAVDPLDPHRVADGRARLALVAEVLESLPERTRRIFVLYRLENIGQEQIADSFGISVSAVKKHVARAMLALTKAIEVAI